MKRIEAIAEKKNNKLEIVRREKFASAISDLNYEHTERNINKLLNDNTASNTRSNKHSKRRVNKSDI